MSRTVFLALVLVASVSAQTRFTSVYTSLDQGCKTIKGYNGTDNAFVCDGATGYEVNIFYSAAAMFINAELKGTNETFNLATLDFGFDARKSRVEWRLADGKPFAAIIRVPKYGPRKTSDLYFGEVVGEELIVKGLKGHEKISGQVDAKKADANAMARAIADKAYTSPTGSSQPSTHSNEWNSIVPLKTSRADVEQKLGKPTPRSVARDAAIYQTNSERVSVLYSMGRCDGSHGDGWDIPELTVIEILVRPDTHPALSSLKFDMTKFSKHADPEIHGLSSFTSEELGISFTVNEPEQIVEYFKYFPRLVDSDRKCKRKAK